MLLLLFVLLSVALPGASADIAATEEFNVDSCSLYCAAAPTISVSSHLAPQGAAKYDALQLDDGSGKTAWVVGRGPGEWVELTFEAAYFPPGFPIDNHRLGVDRLYIWNGYNKSERRWRDHSRVHELELAIDGVPSVLITLRDDPRPQVVALPATLLHRDIRFRLTIRSVYAGAKYDEVAISEARLDGYGHH